MSGSRSFSGFARVLPSILLGLSLGCGGGSSSSPPPPAVSNLNNSTEPAGPPGLVIEINGSSFQQSPGRVQFAQGDNVADVTPASAGWSDTSIVVSVPSGGGQGSFAVPGVVEVSVLTSGGTSNALDLELVTTPVFSVGNVEWSTTTPLPKALRGHQAVAVRSTSTSGFVVVTGGNDGTDDIDTVSSIALGEDGQLGASWIGTTPLPVSRAYHGMVAAHPANSPVDTDDRFLYVIGGQRRSTDAPGGTDAVFHASVSILDGTVGAWSETSRLPEPLVGAGVTLYSGVIYVIGGLRPDGTPSSNVYTARVAEDGSLDDWQLADNPLPGGISCSTVFGFGANLYVVGGDDGAATDLNAQVEGIKSVWFAPVRNGRLGTWQSTSSTSKRRQKHTVWVAFGQVLGAEGVYQGSPGSVELERTVVQTDGALESWNPITASSKQIGANVYNAAALVSPLRPDGSGPRFLLLGGQSFSASPPGDLSDQVYYNTAP